MKIVRISGSELREWRDVKPKLVSPEGALLRELTEEEHVILAELSKRVKHTKRGLEWQSPDKQKTIRVVRDDQRPEMFATVATIDGFKVGDGRALVRQRFFERYGECQLRLPNGQMMVTIRDPKRVKSSRPTVAPNPDRCKCRLMGKPHPGRHHVNCQWNERAPVAATDKKKKPHGVASGKVKMLSAEAPKPQIPGTFTPLGDAKPTARVSGGTSAKPKGEALTSPANCDCGVWPWPGKQEKVEGRHHPICGKREAWERAHPPGDAPAAAASKVLMDLDTREVLRDATNEEIAEASENGVAQVGDKTFGVVDPSEVQGAPA